MSFPGPDQVAGWGAAQQQPAPPPAEGRSKAPVVVLAVLAALFAIAAGVLTVLYFGEQAEADRTATAVAEKQRDVDAAKGELGEAQEAEKAATDELESQENRKSELEAEKSEIAACNAAAKKYIDAPDGLAEAERDKLFESMYDKCRLI